jgi:hypothetical protein
MAHGKNNFLVRFSGFFDILAGFFSELVNRQWAAADAGIGGAERFRGYSDKTGTIKLFQYFVVHVEPGQFNPQFVLLNCLKPH